MKKNLFTIATAAMLLSCSHDSEIRMVVGTYTNSGSTGLYSFSFNEDTCEFAILDSCRTVNPSYLTFSADGKIVYAVSELDEGGGAAASFSFDRQSGSFTEINRQATEGASPCYISTNGKIVVTANYNGGSLSVFSLADDGSLQPVKALFSGSVGGPDAERQEAPHVHCAEFSVDGKYLYASDFSADRVLCFDVVNDGNDVIPSMSEEGELTIAKVVPDYGPRHIIFDREGKHAYIIGELSGFVTVFDVVDGKLVSKQVIDADPFDGRGSSDIHLSPDGRFLYASNRLKGDGIAVFSVDADSGELTMAGYTKTGIHPRHFNITPNGKFLLCACRDTDAIEIYSINKHNGQLTYTGKNITLKKPVCVQFVK